MPGAGDHGDERTQTPAERAASRSRSSYEQLRDEHRERHLVADEKRPGATRAAPRLWSAVISPINANPEATPVAAAHATAAGHRCLPRASATYFVDSPLHANPAPAPSAATRPSTAPRRAARNGLTATSAIRVSTATVALAAACAVQWWAPAREGSHPAMIAATAAISASADPLVPVVLRGDHQKEHQAERERRLHDGQGREQQRRRLERPSEDREERSGKPERTVQKPGHERQAHPPLRGRDPGLDRL